MATHNPNNERVKHRYLAYLKEADRYSEVSVDAAAKALSRFEEFTGRRDFKAFHFEQAIAFKRRLAEQRSQTSGNRLSKATLHSTLAHLKRFFHWLAGQSGYRRRLSYSDSNYFNLSEKDTRVATATREKAFPTIEQVKHVIATMSDGSEVDRRNRALLAFTLLTGARDGAIASMKLRHVDLVARCVYQDAREVNTKFSKTFTTYFFPVGDDIWQIFEAWVLYLRQDKLWGNDDPLFPATRTAIGGGHQFAALGLKRQHWGSAGPIRSNFFYTRAVPCELWHFDRAKPPERRDKVLMLDARNVYRKVTRKICDFSPEQMHNLAAIVWLYRGQQKRFLGLVKGYLGRVCAQSLAVPGALASFETTLADLRGRFDSLGKAAAKHGDIDGGKKQALADATAELRKAATLYKADTKKLLVGLTTFGQKHAEALPDRNDAQHAARKAFDPSAEAIRGLVKQVDLLYKLASRVADLGGELAADDAISVAYDRRATGRLIKNLDAERKAAVEQLKHAAYFHRQVAWLQDRFPKAELEAVPGLVKLVDRKDIEAADWSLTPGRYVGVTPSEEDEDFDFEQTRCARVAS